MFLFGFFAIAVASSSSTGLVYAVLFIGLAIPFLAWGIYRTFHLPGGLTLKDRTSAAERRMESRKAFGSQASSFELYNTMLSEDLRTYGPQRGLGALERRISLYMSAGMTRSEAVRKIAEERGY